MSGLPDTPSPTSGPGSFVGGQFREASFRGQELAGADFSRADARAADLSDANLAGAVFHEADLRGADLSGTNLSGADLGQARVGLQTPAKVVLFGLALLIAIAAGVVVGLVAEWMRERTFDRSWYELAQGLSAAAILFVFLAVLAARGIKDAVRVFFVLLVLMAVAGVLIGGLAGAYRIGTAIQLVTMVLIVVAAVVAGLLGRVVAGTFGGASILLVALGASLVTGGFGGGLGAMAASILIVIAAKRGLAQPRRTIARSTAWPIASHDFGAHGSPEPTCAVPRSRRGGLRNCDVTGALMDEPARQRSATKPEPRSSRTETLIPMDPSRTFTRRDVLTSDPQSAEAMWRRWPTARLARAGRFHPVRVWCAVSTVRTLETA